MSVFAYDKDLNYLGNSGEIENGESSYELPEGTCFIRFSYFGSTAPNITFTNEVIKTETTSSVSSSILTATLSPSNATNQNVTWTVDNENVELVPNGLNCTVKGKAVGNSVVTCTSQDTTNGTISDSCNVTVNVNTSSNTNTNLLDGVHCTENTDGNIIFDSITLGAGTYEYKNIDDGTFTWLGINADNKGRYEII